MTWLRSFLVALALAPAAALAQFPSELEIKLLPWQLARDIDDTAGTSTLYFLIEGGTIPLTLNSEGSLTSPALGGAIALAPSTPLQITANQNDYAPTFCDAASLLRLSSDAARSITGISASSCATNRLATFARAVWVLNVGSFDITLEDEDAGSAAANRFDLLADLTLSPGHAILIAYDVTTTRWRQMTPSMAASGGVSDGDKGDVAVTGGGATWTVEAVTCTNCLNATQIDGGALEAELEAVLDLAELQNRAADDLSDVTIASALAGHVLVRNVGNTAFENVAVSGDASLAATGALEVTQADALEANGSNCSGGQAAGGVDTAGAAEACLDPIEETELDDLAELDTQIGTTGTATSSTFLRGDNSWATPSAGAGGQTTEAQFSNAGALEGADLLTFASSTSGANFGAGSASAGTWPKFNAGTVMTTAEDGAWEEDAETLYHSTDAGNRGYVPIRHCIRADSTRALTSSAAEQALFNSPTNGRLTLETGTYRFEGSFYLSGMSATSGNAAIDPLGAGTATATAWLWQVIGLDNTTVATVGNRTGQTVITQQTAASAVTAGTGTAMTAFYEGTVEITGAGTMIPSVTLVTAAAATLNLGSFFCIERIGSNTRTSVGQWD